MAQERRGERRAKDDPQSNNGMNRTRDTRDVKLPKRVGSPVIPGVRQLRLGEESMRIERCLIGGMVLLLPLFVSHTFLAQTTQKRELSRYDDGGTFDFNWGAGPQAHERMRPKLREFLWGHWSQKRMGRVVVTFYSIEGDPTTLNLYVEPGEDGRWRVVSEYENECCWFYSMEKPKRKRERRKGIDIYNTVERVEGPNGFSLRLRKAGENDSARETFIL